MLYEYTTEADRLQALFEHGDIDLDEVVARAVSDLIEHSLRYLSFVDGSEWVLPCPWATSSEAA